MGGGPAVSAPNAGYMHLITDTRPWYKNKRMISFNCTGCMLMIARRHPHTELLDLYLVRVASRLS